jgi:hypothetical protein
MPRLNIDGGCHCGKIRYEANVDTDNVVICHCTDCQAMSGGPYRANVIVKAENFRLTGQPKTYIKTTGDSGIPRRLTFCPDCGAGLFSTTVETPTRYNLRIGGVTQRAELVPKLQGFCRSALPWAFDLRDIPRVPERAPSN